jgi:hypothetical protein
MSVSINAFTYSQAQPASPSYLPLPQPQIFLTYEFLTYERAFCFSMLNCRLDGPQNHIVERDGLTHEALAMPLTGNSPGEVMAFAEHSESSRIRPREIFSGIFADWLKASASYWDMDQCKQDSMPRHLCK